MKQLVVVVAIVMCARPAFADPKADARVHMEAAGAAFKEGRFDDTLAELNKAYVLDPQPELHYSIGQVYVKLNRCGDAILAYENFLASKPSADRADLANQAIAKCKAQTASQPPPPTDPKIIGTTGTTGAPPVSTDPPGEPKPNPTAPTTNPIPETHTDAGPPAWYKDKLAIGLTGGGAIITIAGLVLLSSANSTAEDAAKAENYGESSSQYDDAKSQRTTALVVTTLGLAAIGVGVWRFMKVKKAQEQSGVALVPTTSGGLITYSSGF